MFKFELTEQESNLVMQALGELPAKMTMQLISKLHIQAKEQLDAKNNSVAGRNDTQK